MKHTTRRGILLGIGLLGVSALLGQMSPASAQPRNDQRDNQRENQRDNSSHQNNNKPENNKPDNGKPEVRPGNRNDSQGVRQSGSWNTQQRTDTHPGNTAHESNRPQNGWDNSRPEYNRPGNFRSGSGWQRPDEHYEQHPVYVPSHPVYVPSRPLYTGNEPSFGHTFEQSYSGTVTRVHSDQSFDININGNIFNVYTLSRIPRSLSVGDWVRVSGVQQYSNDIRNADVTILNQR